MATFEQLINRTYVYLWQPSDSVNFDADNVVKPKINSVVNQICKGIYINPMTQQRYSAGDLPFLRKQEFYDIVDKTTLTTDMAAWDTTVSFDTNKFASSGAIFSQGQVIRYTSKNSSQILGVTWTISSLSSGVNIYQVYALPTNISNPFTVFLIDENGRSIEIPYIDDRYKTNSSYYYTIVQDNDWHEYIHFFGRMNTSGKIQLIYYVNSIDMVLLTDECVLPDCLDMVSAIAAAELAYENEELEDAKSKFDIGLSKLNAMYVYYTSRIKRNKQQVVPQAWDFRGVNGWYGIRWQVGKRR